MAGRNIITCGSKMNRPLLMMSNRPATLRSGRITVNDFVSTLGSADRATALRALRDTVFAGQWPVHQRARAAVAAAVGPAEPGHSHADRNRDGYRQLRTALDALGSSSAVAADTPLVFALFDWAAAAAPDMFPLLSGHFTLTVGAIQRLGEGTAEQKQAVQALDDGHAGVLLLTELGYGSNVLEMRTEARWDADRRTFTLHTPEPVACKFMPNVGEETTPKTTVVAARLVADGRDEGVFLFVLPLRPTADTLAPGVSVHRLPNKGFCPMDNAMIRFDHVVVPEGA